MRKTLDKVSIDVQGDNTVDKGLISAPFVLLSLRVRPVRVVQVPERGQKSSPFRLVDSNRRNFSDLQGRRLRRTRIAPCTPMLSYQEEKWED